MLEVLACGTPVVATSVDGIPEQIHDGITGFLTPPRDADAMATRVVQLIEDEWMRMRMGAESAEDAKMRFDIERQAAEYLRWYEWISNKTH